jgi:His-Xaa-Ser system protein HxsD
VVVVVAGPLFWAREEEVAQVTPPTPLICRMPRTSPAPAAVGVADMLRTPLTALTPPGAEPRARSFMTERQLTFESSAHSVDAIQRAIYKFSDRLSCDLATNNGSVHCTLHLLDEDADTDATLADFRNEVLDQTLRERIRGETSEVRNLILALAFSKTGLTQSSDD